MITRESYMAQLNVDGEDKLKKCLISPRDASV